jgi:hypothetical protein
MRTNRSGEYPVIRCWHILLPLALLGGGALVLFTLDNPLPSVLALGLAACFAVWLKSSSGSAWREAILTDAGGDHPTGLLVDGAWFLAGSLFLGVALWMLEWRQPYYFTQDDALVAELPAMLTGCRGVWAGIWPNFNPYTNMGAPLANLGLNSLTYPPTYLAYAIARHFLADEYATLEVFAVLHLCAGYLVLFGLVRQQGGSSAVAVMVALCVVLSGSTLIIGRCWPAFVPLVLWLPVLAWGMARLCQGPVGWLWTVVMGSAIGLTFHVGFPQNSLWVTGFFVAAVPILVVLSAVPWRRGLFAVPAVLLGVGIALPIALPQMRVAEGMGPRGELGGGLPLPEAWLCMVFPYPIAQAAHPKDWGTFEREYMGQLYFFGGLLVSLFVANFLALLSTRWSWPMWRGQFWFLAAAVTLLLMQGDAWGLWGLIRSLPVVGRVNSHPFRLLPFFVLFASLAGGLVLERTLRRAVHRRSWEVVLALGVGVLLLYHVSLARPSFYTYSFRPYAALPEEMATLLGAPDAPTGRVMAWSHLRSTNPASASSLFNALPAVYRVPAFNGYDPLVENTPPYTFAAHWFRESPWEAARAYGLRWHLSVQGIGPIRAADAGLYAMEEKPPFAEAFDKLAPLQLPRAFESGPILMTQLADVDPLAFRVGHPEEPMPLRMHVGGIDVDVETAQGHNVIVNFLWRPQMKAWVDGVATPCEFDSWLRIRVEIPPGARKLEIRYAPDWMTGIWCGSAAIIAGVGLQLLLRRRAVT